VVVAGMLEIERALDLALVGREVQQQARHAGLDWIAPPAAGTDPATTVLFLAGNAQRMAAGGADKSDRLAGLVSHDASRSASAWCRPRAAWIGPHAPRGSGSEPPSDPHATPGDDS